MKKLVIVLALLFAVTAFTACSGQTAQEDNGVFVKGDRIYYETETDRQQIKISFTEAGFGRDWLVNIAKQFVRENPEYLILLDGDPVLGNSVSTKLESGRNLSDIFMPLNGAWENFAYQDWLEPLDDVFAMKPDGEGGKTNEEKTDSIYLEYSSLTTKNGKHYYIMPWNDAVTGIVYNKNMFKQNGWEIPESTDELQALCDRILADTAGKVKPFVYPGKIGGYFDYIGTTWWMQKSGIDGVKSFYEFESAAVYDASKQPAAGKKQALEEFSRFFAADKGYGVSGSMSKDHVNAQIDFLNGNAAMIVNGNWMECEMQTSTPEGFRMGIMSIPFLSGAKQDGSGKPLQVNYTTPPDYIMIPKQAPNKSGAKKFLNFMNRDDMLKLYTVKSGSPRPFDYEMLAIDGITEFTADALKIRENSLRYFDFSREKIYMGGYAQKYVGGQPYSALVRGETTATRFVNSEYITADEKWAEWLKNA